MTKTSVRGRRSHFLRASRGVEPLERRTLFSGFGSVGGSVPGELLVGFEPGVSAGEITRLYAEYGISELKTLGRHLFGSADHLKLVSAPAARVDELIRALEQDRRVRYAEPNRIMAHPAAVPNDPFLGADWGLINSGQTGGTPDADVDADEAWDITTGGSEVIVAVIDTGVDYTHPDLVDNMWTNDDEIPGNGLDDDDNGFTDDYHGYDVINNDGDPMDVDGHGTHVAGTIGMIGNNAQGSAGVNWAVKIMAIKMIDGYSTIEAIVAAYDYVVMMKGLGVNVRVTNESFGSFGTPEEGIDEAFIDAHRDASDALGAAGILEVAAAMNETTDHADVLFMPAGFDSPHIISVASTDHDDRFSLFSNWGATSVDLAAPGDGILSTVAGGGYDVYSGTSMAAPHVAGAAALVWAAYPDLTVAEVKARLLNSVDPIGHVGTNATRPTVTNGRLNVRNALVVPGPDAGDVTPPAAVGNLAVVDVSPWSATLTWAATGDDGAVGRAGFYDVRYSTSPITAGNWADAERGPLRAGAARYGAAESFTVTGLEPGTLYYFAMKVKDNAQNESGLSAPAAGQTAAAKDLVDENAERGGRNWNATGLWHRSRLRGYDSETAWYYGVDRTRTYDTGEGTTGALTLATPIDLRHVDGAILRFNEFRQPGMAPFPESARVEVSTDGENWDVPFDARYPIGGWARREIDLAPYAGGKVHLRFVFDSLDQGFPPEELFNEFEGWYVDNVRVLAPAATPAGFSVNDVLVTEGHDGTARATFTVTRSSGAGRASVSYETADGRATSGHTHGGHDDDRHGDRGGDYRTASGVLSFAPGEKTKTVTVRVNGDRLGEEDESFVLRLSRAEGAGISDDEGRATIIDDEPRLILFTPWVAWEGNADPEVTFEVYGLLSALSDEPVTFRYSTRDGTARGGRDYERAYGTLTFNPGESWKFLPIKLIADTRVEAFEHFFIDVRPTSGNALASRGGVFYILDDDLPPEEEVLV